MIHGGPFAAAGLLKRLGANGSKQQRPRTGHAVSAAATLPVATQAAGSMIAAAKVGEGAAAEEAAATAAASAAIAASMRTGKRIKWLGLNAANLSRISKLRCLLQILLVLPLPVAGVAHDAWVTCAKLAEPGTEVGQVVHSLVAAALKQPRQRQQQQQQQHQQQQEQHHQQQQQLLAQQHLELCVGIGWVAACARDLMGSFEALGIDGSLRLFQICDPEGARQIDS
ncbi:hypothetical protein ACSSS7_004565 [Eimeria intestinalis]